MKFILPLLVKKVIKDFQKNNFEIYIVGGAVRDLLMAKATYDWDFTTNATPEEIQKILPESFYDNRFGTVGIAVKDLIKRYQIKDKPLKGINTSRPFEITTFRTEGVYRDGRHPNEVSWGKTLEEDLERRDFTINAMAIKIQEVGVKTNQFTIIDPFGGQQDLQKKLIRAVGEPAVRFKEDALRLMRAIRIAAELGFSIEEKTLKAIAENHQLLNKISAERLRDELFKILKANFPADGLKLLAATHLLEIILPELSKTQGVQQAGHHTTDVWHHSLASLANCPSPEPVVRLAALLHDIGKPVTFRKIENKITFYGHEVVGTKIASKIAERLKFSQRDKEKLLILIRYHMFAYQPAMTDASIRRFIRKVGRENINDMILLRIADRLGGGSRATSWRLRELQERIGKVLYTPMQIKDLKVNGYDVMKTLKLKPGPKVGKILNQLFEEVLEDAAKNKREYLLKRMKALKTT